MVPLINIDFPNAVGLFILMATTGHVSKEKSSIG